MKKFLFTVLAAFFAVSTIFSSKVEASEPTIIFFWAEGCPHCASESRYLEILVNEYPDISIDRHEVTTSRDNQKLLIEWSQKLHFDPNGVPVTIIGDQYVLGYMDGVTDRKIEDMLKAVRVTVPEGEVCQVDKPCDEEQKPNHMFNVPLIGQIETKDLSLPVLSIAIGALDGFNPCAMWTLLFLISILLGMKDKKRMWILGSAFIVASAAVYFVFMSAWLNLLLFIGFIAAVRIFIGLVALGGGTYNIKEYFMNKESGCKVTGSEGRRKTFDRIKNIVHEQNFLLALAGIILLAFAVNLVELICSAGLPAIYTQILTLNYLPAWEYYLYIFLYIFFFMLDDLIVFFIAMFTLQLTGITTKYSRLSKLVGGIIMLIIGFLLVFKPSWLMFG